MVHITATEPALVWDHKTLSEFRHALKQEDPVIVSVDFENVDHLPGPGITQYQKMSELGVAVYDTRNRPSTSDRPYPTDGSNSRLESLAKLIVSEHIITEEFRDQTEETCEAPYHRRAHVDPGCAHHARPYHCRFVDSMFLTKADTMQLLGDIIKDLSTQSLTDQEKAAGITRNIKVIVWDSHCEESTLYHGGLDLATLCPSIELWNIQIWYPFRARFHEKPNSKNAKTKGEKAFGSLGALGTGLPLHNGCNDTVVQLIAFLRFMLMTEAEWVTWFDHKTDLAPISFGWVDPAIYQRNLAMAPVPKPRAKGRGKGKTYQRYGRDNWKREGQEQTTSWQPSQAEFNTFSNSTSRLLADDMANLNLEPSASTPSDSSGTGWPEGMEGFDDWSQSSKHSSGDNTSSGWPVDTDSPDHNIAFWGGEKSAQDDSVGRGWPSRADNDEEHEHSDVTVKALDSNHIDWSHQAPRRKKRGRKKPKTYVEDVEWAL
ncbi:hypothetical protein QR685DRAFT_575483 [Neurospora intermedia]|uniref:Uncharacterized protein n=1 Tax=Neurospora intermedia TaxID=5142 RepID=A0ABR3D107_NEUIN